MKKVLFIIPVLAALVSCNKETALQSISNDSPREICFTVDDGFSAEAATKATSAVTSLSSFYVAAATGTAGSADTYAWGPVSFTGSTSYTGGKYWPASNPSYHFYASNVSMTCTANSAPTIAATNGTDIVCAYLASPTYNASNALSFNHIFARLGKTTVTVQSGYTASNISIIITPKTGGTYNLLTGNAKTDGTGWSSTTNGSAVTLATATGETAATDVYLVPGSYTITATYTLKKGDYSITKSSVTKTVSIKGGAVNAIKATIGGASASDITFTVSVAAWGSNEVSPSFS